MTTVGELRNFLEQFESWTTVEFCMYGEDRLELLSLHVDSDKTNPNYTWPSIVFDSWWTDEQAS